MASPVAYAFQIMLLAVWLTCAGVGVTGLALGWPSPAGKKPEPPPVQATLIESALQQDSPADAAAPAEPPPPPTESPPPVPDLPDLPPLPDLPAFVERAPPAPALPQETRPNKAQPSAEPSPHPSTRPATGAPAVQNLTMGQGEGRQPAPPYPRDALSRRQEGTVIVQLLVGAEGNVLSAEVWQASPWPLLNDAAVRTVRGRWQFPKGPVRLYRVPIRFRIQ